MPSGSERFSVADLDALSELVATAWLTAAGRDWSARGLRVPFEPPAALCRRLRDHTRAWPMWTVAWDGLGSSDDPWGDLLAGSGRGRQSPDPA